MSAPLEFDAVSVAYGNRFALRSVCAEFAAGCVTGLLGTNGAGKTTLLRAASGLSPPAHGTVRVLGRSLASWNREALARSVAYLPQQGDAYWPVRAAELVALGRMPHRPAFSGLSAANAAAVARALARCDAAQFADRRMDRLSSGERARVLLARALATGARILLVDEPAAHLDPAHQLQIMELLRDEAAQGAAVVVTLHDLALAERFCDRLAVLKSGTLVAQGPACDTLSDQLLGEAFQLRRAPPGSGSRYDLRHRL